MRFLIVQKKLNNTQCINIAREQKCHRGARKINRYKLQCSDET